MDAAPTLSVTVLNYNYGRFLPGCLDAILAQTFTDFEVIVIDDVSTDDSLQVVQPYLADPRVRLVAHEQNAGFAASLLEGTEVHSRGEFLMVISADDMVMRPDAFATQLDLLRRNPRAAFCFSSVERLMTTRPNEIHESFSADTVLGPREALHALLTVESTWPAHSGTMVRRAAYHACGGYRRDVTMPLDLALWVDLAMEGGFAYTALPLYGYRIHEGQMSASLAGVRRNTVEVATILRRACRKGEKRGFGTRRLERPSVRAHLSGSVMFDAFSDRRRVAATRILAALRECPVETLTTRPMWVAAFRTLLGKRAFDSFRAFRRAAARRLPARAPGGAP
ncbi:MAG: glycosyltransferase family 2 protein [Dehalococcoidia bacterium]|nr:glycosyltransferase family 2 protein [Dehalococcoidia bacterium]